MIRLFLLLIISIMLLAACRGQPKEGSDLHAQDLAKAGWSTHQDPIGFSVAVPQGWEVRGDRPTGRVTIRGPEDEQLIVWPIFVPERLELRTGTAALQQLAQKILPAVHWEAAVPAGNAMVRARGRDGRRARALGAELGHDREGNVARR